MATHDVGRAGTGHVLTGYQAKSVDFATREFTTDYTHHGIVAEFRFSRCRSSQLKNGVR